MDDNGGETRTVFGIYDYLALGFMLGLSILIGLYSAFFKRDNTVEAYLFGNRNLKVFPVAASIMASEVSSLIILTFPTEVYLYGSNMFYNQIGKFTGGALIYFVTLPMLYNMGTTTIYEYLEKRFDRSVRTLCSFFFTLQQIFTMPILMCITTLSLSLVTGLDFYMVTIVTGAVTTFYTAIGGIRAVVWADTVQAFFMFGGVIAVTVKGIMDVGSLTALWNKNVEFHRLTAPDLRLDFTEKYGFWVWTIAGTFRYVVNGSLNQGIVQRYLSVPNLSSARLCLVVSKITGFVFTGICMIIGMIFVAEFGNCDPLQSRSITGLPGLFIAAVVSAAISTVSTLMNSVAAVVLNDYYKTFNNKKVSEKTSNIVMKLTVVMLGIIVTLVSFFVKSFGSAFQIYIIFSSPVIGLTLGTFIIGFFLPIIKSKPTFLGGIAGFTVILWIATGMNTAVESGRLTPETKPLSVEGCETNVSTPKNIYNNDEVFILYRISSLWYTVFGMLLTVTVSCLLSLFMERNDVSKMDRKLFSPLIHRWLPKKSPIVDAEMLLKDQKLTN